VANGAASGTGLATDPDYSLVWTRRDLAQIINESENLVAVKWVKQEIMEGQAQVPMEYDNYDNFLEYLGTTRADSDGVIDEQMEEDEKVLEEEDEGENRSD
jgi:hypothetical protein